MSAKVHILLKCGRVHHKRHQSKHAVFGRRCCYVAVVLHEDAPENLCWDSNRLQSAPHARSAPDRKNGNNPIWNEHLHVPTSKLANMTISLRDESAFELQPADVRMRRVRPSHFEIGSVTIPVQNLEDGELFLPRSVKVKHAAKAAALSRAAREGQELNPDNPRATESQVEAPSSPNRKISRFDHENFFPVELRDGKGRLTATVWARIQVQYPFSIVLPPTMRSQQVLADVRMNFYEHFLLLSIHSVELVNEEVMPAPRGSKIRSLVRSDRQTNMDTDFVDRSLAEFTVYAEVDAVDPELDDATEVLCETSTESSHQEWSSEHFWIPIERGQRWVKFNLQYAGSTEVVAHGILELCRQALTDGFKNKCAIRMNRMVRGQKCEMAKLHVSLQLQYSASIMIPQHMTAADLGRKSGLFLMDEPRGAPPVYFRKYIKEEGFVPVEEAQREPATAGTPSAATTGDDSPCKEDSRPLLSPKNSRMRLLVEAKSSQRDNSGEQSTPQVAKKRKPLTIRKPQTGRPLQVSPPRRIQDNHPKAARKPGSIYFIDFYEPGSTGLHIRWLKRSIHESKIKDPGAVLHDAPTVTPPLIGQALTSGKIQVGDALLAVGNICVQDLRRQPDWGAKLFQTHMQPRPLRVWFLAHEDRKLSQIDAGADHRFVPQVLRQMHSLKNVPVQQMLANLMTFDVHLLVEGVDALGLPRGNLNKQDLVNTLFHHHEDITTGNFSVPLPPTVSDATWEAVRVRMTLPKTEAKTSAPAQEHEVHI